MLIKLQCIIAIVFILAVISCRSPHYKLEEAEALVKISSEDWQVREKGLFMLSGINDKNYKPNKETQNKLLNLIITEINKYKEYESKLKSEGKSSNEIFEALYEKYSPQTYGDYIKALALFSSTKNIKNSMPALFKLIVDTNYNISPQILILYGPKHLDYFIEKANTGMDKERETAICVLASWINPSIESDTLDANTITPLTKPNLKKAEDAFLKAINDPDYNVRYVVLSSLNSLIDRPEVRKIVENIAKSDSEQFIRSKAADILKNKK